MKCLLLPRQLLVSCATVCFTFAPGAAIHASPVPRATQDGTRTVRVVRPRRENIDRSVDLLGTVLPWQSATIKSRVTGYVANVAVMPGDRVEEGGLLCTLDLPGLQAEMQAAHAAIAEAEAMVSGKRGNIAAARADVLDAEAAEHVAEAQIAVREAAVQVAQAEQEVASAILDRKQALREVKAATIEEVEEAQGRLDSARAHRMAATADVAMAQAQLVAAQARTEAARARIEAAEAQVAGAEAAVDSARAALELVTSQLQFGELRAPFGNALVTERFVDTGALAQAQHTELLTLMDVSRVRLQIHVPERHARIVRAGTRVVIELDGADHERVEAAVSRVSGALSIKSRTMAIEIDLDNAAGTYYPGMFFHTRIAVETLEDAMLLPGSAVHTQRKQNYVLVVGADGTVERKDVKLGVDDGRTAQVLSGLTGDERVVEALVAGLREGDRVRALEEQKP